MFVDNSTRYMAQWTESTLIQVMACHWTGSNLLNEFFYYWTRSKKTSTRTSRTPWVLRIPPWLPKLLTSSYWIPSQYKTMSKLQIQRFCQNFNFFNFEQGKSGGFDSCDRPSNLKLDLNRRFFSLCDLEIWWMTSNKANLRDLIAATGLIILLKLDSNCRFFSRETPNLGKNWPWNLTDDLQKQ